MRPAVAALLALLWASAGCREPSSAEQGDSDEGCGYEDREVALDAKFGDETPGEVIALIERPVDGRVTWYGGDGEYIDVGGALGETEYHAQARFRGPTAWIREGIEGQGGILEERLFCPTVLLFDVDVEIETEDGALADTWRGRAEYMMSGTLGGAGGIAVTVPDPRPFAGSLTITEHPDVPAMWETHEPYIHLVFVTSPLGDRGMHGTIRYNLLNLGDGEGNGVTVTIGEFVWVQ